MSVAARHVLAQQMLDAPRIYLSSDADPVVGRGDDRDVCAGGSIWFVNPAAHPVRDGLELVLHQRASGARTVT